MSPKPMTEEVRKWLLEKLTSWLHTWDDLEEEQPNELVAIVVSLEKGWTFFAKESYESILFHLWQIAQQDEGYTYLKVPDADWELLSETLSMDTQSSVIEKSLRDDIAKAFENVEVL